MCVDYRRLNEITVKNRYILPLIHEMQDRIRKAKFFTKLDLREAYYKIRIKEGEKWKTAWRSRLGHYEQLIIPFKLTNAPATCQTLINDILWEYLDIFVFAYLDDILIYLENEEDHIKQITLILQVLEKANMGLHPEKCVFHVKEIKFLDYILIQKGIKMDPVKVKAV
jgi:Reverse transcriptase (RNA-dependent DNA polymerase)